MVSRRIRILFEQILMPGKGPGIGLFWEFGSRAGLLPCTVWKLLIIQPFSKRKLNKIETENSIGISGCSWCCWKALGK
jgi:hypothetical protein